MIIDVTRLTGRLLQKHFPTGVDRVDIEYIRRYRDHAIALIRYRGRWLFLSSNESNTIFDILIHSHFMASWKIRLIVTKRWWFSWFASVPTEKVLLNLSHSGLDEPTYIDQVAKYGFWAYYFVHDCIPLLYPEYARPGEYLRHYHRLKSVFSSARGVIVNSDDTKEQVKYFASSMGFEMPKVAVSHLGFSPLEINTVMTKTPKEAYFVVVSTLEGRKNHLLLLNIWRKMAFQYGENTPKLIIIGQRGWENENAVDMLERCEKIRPYIEEKDRCTDSELVSLLRGARALLFPSFAEGYGLPLIEAIANNVPVIASDLNVFHEIAGDIPEYLDPIDGIGWEIMILEYAKVDSVQRKAQFERMKGFQIPTWTGHFKQVEEVFEDLVHT